MMKIIVFLAAMLLGLVGVYYFVLRDTENKSSVLIIGGTRISVEVADTIPKQILGLSGRESLCSNCGMVFVYRTPQIRNFTMKGMKFPLDMIFIQDRRIIETRLNIPFPEPGEQPVTVRSQQDADMVLEVNAGFVFKNGVKVWDSVESR